MPVRDTQSLPAFLDGLSGAFPFGIPNLDTAGRQSILLHLPIKYDAITWTKAYFEQCVALYVQERAYSTSQLIYGCFSAEPMGLRDFIDNVLGHVYSTLDHGEEASLHFHEVSLLFFTIGTALAFERYNTTGESQTPAELSRRYHALGRAAFSLEPLGRRNTVWTVTSLIMFVNSTMLIDWEASAHRWSIVGLAAQVAHSVSLSAQCRLQ